MEIPRALKKAQVDVLVALSGYDTGCSGSRADGEGGCVQVAGRRDTEVQTGNDAPGTECTGTEGGTTASASKRRRLVVPLVLPSGAAKWEAGLGLRGVNGYHGAWAGTSWSGRYPAQWALYYEYNARSIE